MKSTIILWVIFALGFLFLTVVAKAADNEIKKDWAHWQQSEFCASVKLPPKKLVDSINNAAAQNPAEMAEIVAWLQRIAERW